MFSYIFLRKLVWPLSTYRKICIPTSNIKMFLGRQIVAIKRIKSKMSNLLGQNKFALLL